MIKALKELGKKEMYIDIIQVICCKTIANIVLVGKTENISSKIRNEIRMSTLQALTQYSARILNQINKARERNERATKRKGRSQIIPVCKQYDYIHKRLQRLQ
jgi:hypothetical protein